jgi:hypothetical protein
MAQNLWWLKNCRFRQKVLRSIEKNSKIFFSIKSRAEILAKISGQNPADNTAFLF